MKLLLTYYVSVGDVERAADVAEWIEQLGGVKEYDALVLATDAAAKLKSGAALSKIKNHFEKAFNKVKVVEAGEEIKTHKRQDDTKDWIPNNWAFARTLDCVALAMPSPLQPEYDAFYFFESDCTPLKPGWLKDLDREYRKSEATCMGCIREMSDTEGRSLGLVMNGSAIYSTSVRSKIMNLRLAVSQNVETAVPWDVLCREDLVPISYHTPLIQTNFKNDPWTSDKVSKDAVVVHGCKDRSLLKLLRKSNWGSSSPSLETSSRKSEEPAKNCAASYLQLPYVKDVTESLTVQEYVKLGFNLGFERVLKLSHKDVRSVVLTS